MRYACLCFLLCRGYYDPNTDISGALIHELSHQLGMIDLYNFGFDLDTPRLIDRNGQPVQMETSLPATGLMLDPGIRPLIYEEHTARSQREQGLPPGLLWRLSLRRAFADRSARSGQPGAPAAGVTLRLYQPAPASGLTSWAIDGTPELSAVTNSTGIAHLPNRPVGATLTTRTNHALHDNPFGVIDVVGERDEFVLEIARGGHQEYAWLNITQINLAAWQSAGQFNDPQGLAVDAAGRVIVADSGNQRLQVLGFDGASFSYISEIKGFGQPTGVAAYRADRIVVADSGAGRVDVLDAAGQPLASYVKSNDGQTGAFSQPRGVAVDQVGSIVVADTGNARVVTIAGAFGHMVLVPIAQR